jgi:hypothetical protein
VQPKIIRGEEWRGISLVLDMWVKLYNSLLAIVLENLKVGRQLCRLAIQRHVLLLQTKQTNILAWALILNYF